MSLSDTPEIKRLVKRLKNSGFEDDEISTLFPDDEALRKFVADMDKSRDAAIEDDGEEGPEPEDKFRLSPEEEKETLYNKKKAEVEAELAPAQSPEDQVSFEDLLKATEGLDDLDKYIEDEDED